MNFYKEKIFSAYKKFVKPMNGASDVLGGLKNRGYKLLLVTSADREIAMEFVKNQGWGKYFQQYVFGNEVSRSKPASEIYDLSLGRALIENWNSPFL